jgi:hypothetical protein
MKTFEVKKYPFDKYWDNVVVNCSVCDIKYWRREGLWIYNGNWKVESIVTHFPVCSEECANMYILQHC